MRKKQQETTAEKLRYMVREGPEIVKSHHSTAVPSTVGAAACTIYSFIIVDQNPSVR